jgi:hypothetical protein
LRDRRFALSPLRWDHQPDAGAVEVKDAYTKETRIRLAPATVPVGSWKVWPLPSEQFHPMLDALRHKLSTLLQKLVVVRNVAVQHSLR